MKIIIPDKDLAEYKDMVVTGHVISTYKIKYESIEERLNFWDGNIINNFLEVWIRRKEDDKRIRCLFDRNLSYWMAVRLLDVLDKYYDTLPNEQILGKFGGRAEYRYGIDKDGKRILLGIDLLTDKYELYNGDDIPYRYGDWSDELDKGD